MDEEKLLEAIGSGDQQAMEAVIRTYSAYVVTVIHNRSRGFFTPADEEEIAADVFVSLWRHSGRVHAGHLTGWLGTVARNRTVDCMRRARRTMPLEEDTVTVDEPQWEALSQSEQTHAVRAALETLNPSDREIFHRYYDLGQNTNEIAAALHMRPATVRTRLKRGRERLRKTLCQRGFDYEGEA